MPLPAARLLARAQAASYCGLSVSAFGTRCSVDPIDFGDKRLERFDRQDLDGWIDALEAPTSGVKSVAEALAEWRRTNSVPRSPLGGRNCQPKNGVGAGIRFRERRAP